MIMDIIKVLTEKYNMYLWKINKTYETLEWDENNSIPKPTLEELENAWTLLQSEKPFEKLRVIRNALLTETDYMFTSDYPLTSESREQWVEYRKTLRDLPQTANPLLDEFGNVVNVSFPVKP